MTPKTVWLAWWWTPEDTGTNGIFTTEEGALKALAESGLQIVLPDAQLTKEQHSIIEKLLARGWKAQASKEFIKFQQEATDQNKVIDRGIWASPYILDEAHI